MFVVYIGAYAQRILYIPLHTGHNETLQGGANIYDIPDVTSIARLWPACVLDIVILAVFRSLRTNESH